jgi:hypothetical protein
MGDAYRRYRAIGQMLKMMYPQEPRGQVARHLNTLVALICGIVGSQRTNLPAVASDVPSASQAASQIKQFKRWLMNEHVEAEVYVLPFVEWGLGSLAKHTLVLVIDGSGVGRGCVTLMVSVVYRGRALPLMWVVRQGNKGHFPQTLPVELLHEVSQLIPAGSDVVCLGDGEFDGTDWLAELARLNWTYVCRTAKNAVCVEEGDRFAPQDICPAPGHCVGVPEVFFTEAAYGPVHVIAWWEKGYQEPLYLVTNLPVAEEACYWYRKRFRIETLFSDQKSRGFHLHKSRLSDPKRLARLMIASCLAYLWVVYLGAFALQTPWYRHIHRTDRCDLSLFQLGLRLLKHFLREGIAIPTFRFTMPEPAAT